MGAEWGQPAVVHQSSGSLVATVEGLLHLLENGPSKSSRLRRETSMVSAASGTQVANRETE